VTNVIESKADNDPIYIKAQGSTKLTFDFIFGNINATYENKKYSNESGKPISSIAKESGKVIIPDGHILPKHYKEGYALEFSKPGLYSLKILFSGYSLSILIDVVPTKSVVPSLVPKGLTATGVTKSQINLKWNAVKGAKSYKIYRATSKSGTYSYKSTVKTNSYKSTGLKAGTSYWYKVSAITIKGEGKTTTGVNGKTKK
jgi:hypothetical protein